MSFKRSLDWLKKHWVALWLVFASLALFAVMIAHADYEEANNKIKRVFAPTTGSYPLFTSDYLEKGTTGNFKSAFFNENDHLRYDVYVRNYNPVDPNTVYEKDIRYTLTAKLVHATGTDYTAVEAADMPGTITITCGSDTVTLNSSNLSGTFPQYTLTGKGDTGKNRYRVQYNDVGGHFAVGCDYCVYLYADAVDNALDDLSATIQVSKYPDVHNEGWNCVLADAMTDGRVYDGFNYTISGTGTKTLYFSYDSSKLEINYANYTLINEIAAPINYSVPGGAHSGDANWKTVIINANPETYKRYRYDIQVYKKAEQWDPAKSDIDPNDDDVLYVEFKASE